MADETEPTTDPIADAAAAPRSITGDQGSVTNQSLPDLIAADKYDRTKKAGRNLFKTIYVGRVLPPNARGY